ATRNAKTKPAPSEQKCDIREIRESAATASGAARKHQTRIPREQIRVAPEAGEKPSREDYRRKPAARNQAPPESPEQARLAGLWRQAGLRPLSSNRSLNYGSCVRAFQG